MPKRKAASGTKQSGAAAGKAKKKRRAAAAARRLAEMNYISNDERWYEPTLLDAIQASHQSFMQRMLTVADLLKEEADHFQPQLDLSLVPEGDESCAMFQLLRFFSECCVENEADDNSTKADKKEAQQLIIEQVMPLNQQWLHSFSPGTVDAETGNNALHEMCSFLLMSDQEDWDYQLAEWFIDRGVSVHARNKSGRTPLLQYAATALPQIDSAAAMRLLLEHGADLNAQGRDGNGVLHYLIQSDAVKLLEDFCTGDEVSRLDCFMGNSSRQNPFDLVADRLAKQPDDQRARDMHRVLKDAQTALWDKHTRPVLQLHLNQVLPVRDLAELTLGFIGGSCRPSDHVATQTDDDQPAASAAAVRS